MQVVAKLVHLYVCTLVITTLVEENHHQCKLHMGGEHISKCASVSEVFVVIDGRKKHHQCKLKRVKTILGTNTSRMRQPDAGSTRARSS